MLESSYLPTLRVLCNAPDVSPLQEVDIFHVSRFILSLTRQGLQKSNGQTFYTHNNLAFAILAEILSPESKIDQEALIKSLMNLHIQIEDDTSKQNLLEAVENVAKMVCLLKMMSYCYSEFSSCIRCIIIYNRTFIR